MLKPSYHELIDAINKNNNSDDVIISGYTIIIAASKRARQLIEGEKPLVQVKNDKHLSTAIDEILNGKILITQANDNLNNITDISEKEDEDLII